MGHPKFRNWDITAACELITHLSGKRQRFAGNSNDCYTQASEGLLKLNLERTWTLGCKIHVWVPSKLESSGTSYPWISLGYPQIPKVIQGVRFPDALALWEHRRHCHSESEMCKCAASLHGTWLESHELQVDHDSDDHDWRGLSDSIDLKPQIGPACQCTGNPTVRVQLECLKY